MIAAYTSGPWRADATQSIIATLEGGAVVDIAFLNPYDELSFSVSEANARLIAAAPDLLAALT